MNNALGKHALGQLIRASEQYDEWYKAVLIRDRFTCQVCGARNGRKRIIQVDHVKGLSLLIQENDLVTMEQALACKAIWDVDNGRAICKACHEQTENFPERFKGATNKHAWRYAKR